MPGAVTVCGTVKVAEPIPAQTVQNILQDLPSAQSAEVFSDVLTQPNLRIERIVSQGQCCAKGEYYDQDHAEWVLLLQSGAQLDMEIDGAVQRLDLTIGSCVFIPAHCRHRVHQSAADEKTVWLAIHINEANKND